MFPVLVLTKTIAMESTLVYFIEFINPRFVSIKFLNSRELIFKGNGYLRQLHNATKNKGNFWQYDFLELLS